MYGKGFLAPKHLFSMSKSSFSLLTAAIEFPAEKLRVQEDLFKARAMRREAEMQREQFLNKAKVLHGRATRYKAKVRKPHSSKKQLGLPGNLHKEWLFSQSTPWRQQWRTSKMAEGGEMWLFLPNFFKDLLQNHQLRSFPSLSILRAFRQKKRHISSLLLLESQGVLLPSFGSPEAAKERSFCVRTNSTCVPFFLRFYSD